MPKFILLALFLGLLVAMLYMPVPMHKIESKLEKEQIQINQKIPSASPEAIASKNASKAFFNGTNQQKIVFFK